MRYILFLCLSLSFGQCSSSKNKSSVTTTEPLIEVEEQSKDEANNTISEDCYPGRKQIKSINGQAATVVTIIGEKMLVFDYTRLHPCNLPEAFAKDDLKVIVSGNTYETPPNVRVAGQPFIIESIFLEEQ